MNKKFYYICLSFFILACGQTKKEVVSEEVTSAEETLIIVSNDQFSLGQMEGWNFAGGYISKENCCQWIFGRSP